MPSALAAGRSHSPCPRAAASAMLDIPSALNGRRCSRPFLVRAAGIIHCAAWASISPRDAPHASPARAPVKSNSRIASRVDGSMRGFRGRWSSQKNRAEGETIDTADLGEEIETSPEDGPPARSDPLTADPPPDEVDEAAWLMIPLLRAAEARWAAMVSPLRDETPPPDPWPWLSVYGLGKRPQQ